MSASYDLEGARRPIFRPSTTAVYALLWAALMVEGWLPVLAADPTSWLTRPVDSAWRIVNRDFEIAETPGASWRPSDLLLPGRDASLASGIAIHEQVLSSLESEGLDELAVDRTRLQLAVLLAESGAIDAAAATAEQVVGVKGFATGLRLAYGEAEAGPSLEALAVFVALREGAVRESLGDLLVARLGRRVGATEVADQLEREVASRAQARRLRWDVLLAVNLAFAIAGIVAWGVLRTSGEPASAAPVPWSLADGLGLLLRADFWSRLYLVVIAYALAPTHSLGADVLDHMATFFASLPLLWLCRHYLLRSDTFGLVPVGADARRLTAIALVAIAIDLAGTYAIGWAGWETGLLGHWTEGFDETLVWGSQREVVLTSLDYVLWGPLFEELAFRGLLYASLRARFGVGAAAILSAMVFATLHFYSPAGFLMTFWSGLVWALTFERARSLLPGIAAHAVYNALYVANQLLIYR